MQVTETQHHQLPHPAGWYAIGHSKDLGKSQVRPIKIAGRELVLFRTESGAICLADAFCPHMGGNIAHGGHVKGETIVCPFHHFCFDTRGDCTQTGYGTSPPPRAKLGTYPVQVRNGFIVAWFHPSGNLPEWEVPEIDQTGWSETRTKEFTLRSHPQEITENSVDLGHFSVVHQYKNIELIKETFTEGPFLFGSYAFDRRPEGFLGASAGGFRAEIQIFVYGLGFSFVEVSLPQLGIKTRNYVLPLPIEENKTRLLIGMSVSLDYSPGKAHPALRFIPKKIRDRLILNKAFAGYADDVSQDFKIWQNKIYLDHPALAKGDGPIGKYRLWAKQFYI